MKKNSLWLTIFIITALSVSVVAGCQRKEKLSRESLTEGKPVKGGQIIYGMLEEPDKLDPYSSQMLSSANVCNLCFDGLIKVDNESRVISWLAEEVPTIANGGISEDGLTITYKLKKAIKWQDGKPLTSGDVKFTWEVIMGKHGKYTPVTTIGYDRVELVKTPDERTVIFHLKEVYAPFVNTLFQFAIFPKHLLEKSQDLNKDSFFRRPVGSGPFKIKEWKSGEYIIAEANSNYFLGRPNLDRIIIKFIPDDNTLFTQMRTGEIDVWEMVPPTMSQQAEQIKEAKLYKTTAVNYENYAFNHSNPILSDKRVRKALWYGTDIKTILEKLYPDSDPSIAVTDQYPKSWAYNKNLKPYPYDPQKAKKLLEKAGWKDVDGDGIREKNGKKLTLTISAPSGKKDREQKEEILQEQWRKIGVDLKIKNYDSLTLFGSFEEGGILTTGKYDVAIFAWIAGVDPDDSSLWSIDQIPSKENPSGQNSYFYRNPKIDRLCKEAVKTMNQEKRKKYYWRIQEILYEDAVTIFERYWVDLNSATLKLHQFKPNPTNQGHMWNVYEWWKEK